MRTSRASLMTRDDDLRVRLGRVRDRAGARRAKPFIAQALAAAEKAGGFKRRSGAERPQWHLWPRPGGELRGRAALTDRTRSVTVKARVVRHGTKRAPLTLIWAICAGTA